MPPRIETSHHGRDHLPGHPAHARQASTTPPSPPSSPPPAATSTAAEHRRSSAPTRRVVRMDHLTIQDPSPGAASLARRTPPDQQTCHHSAELPIPPCPTGTISPHAPPQQPNPHMSREHGPRIPDPLALYLPANPLPCANHLRHDPLKVRDFGAVPPLPPLCPPPLCPILYMLRKKDRTRVQDHGSAPRPAGACTSPRRVTCRRGLDAGAPGSGSQQLQ